MKSRRLSFTIGRKVGLGFTVLLIALGGLFAISLSGLEYLRRQYISVIEHDVQVAGNGRELLKLMVDMEAGQRGFVVTGSDEFLEPYHAGVAKFDSLLDQVRNLVQDNPRQSALLERIDHLQQQWQEEAAKPEIELRQKVASAEQQIADFTNLLIQDWGNQLLAGFKRQAKQLHNELAPTGNLQILGLIEKILTDVNEQYYLLVYYSNTGDARFLDRLNHVHNRIQNRIEKLKTSVPTPILANTKGLQASYEDLYNNGILQAINRRQQINSQAKSLYDVAAIFQHGKGKSLLDQIRVCFSDFFADEQKLHAQRSEHVKWICTVSNSLLSALAVTLVLLGGVMSWNITKSITRPIHRLRSELKAVSEGRSASKVDVKSNDEIGELSHSFNQMLESLRELESGRIHHIQQLEEAKSLAMAANKAKSEFLANMSHEIRTPMTAILGFTEIMREASDNKEVLNAADTVKRNSEELLDLINDILDLSKVESGKLDVEYIPCSPREVLSQVESLMKVRASAKGLPLQTKIAGEIPALIRTDPTRLRQILINLVGNAIKFTETGSVDVTMRMVPGDSKQPQLQVEVSDTGTGMSPETVKSMFKPFTQADSSTTRKFGGTGLGLAISKRIAELLHGEILVQSTLGEGSIFTLNVAVQPCDETELSSESVQDGLKPHPAKPGVSHETNVNLDGCRLLLAEDGPDNQRLIKHVLQKAGAQVTLVENGRLAVDSVLQAEAEGHPFDVILMDMQMPILDGYSATTELRGHGYDRPILALTAHAMSTDRKKCIDAGCDDFCAKPINRSQLLHCIQHYWQQATETTAVS